MKKALLIVTSIVCGTIAMAALSLAGIIAIAMVIGSPHGERIAIQNGELYYTESVNKQEAQRLAEFLEEQYGELENQKTFQMDQNGEDVIVRMAAMDKAWKTDDYDLDVLDERFFDLGYNAKLERDTLKEKESFTRNLLYRLRMPAAEFDLRGDRVYRVPPSKDEAASQEESPDNAASE